MYGTAQAVCTEICLFAVEFRIPVSVLDAVKLIEQLSEELHSPRLEN